MRYLNNEELQLASHFIFLSMAIIVLEQDVQHIQNGKFKIKEFYLDMLERMISEALNERKLLRRKMKRRNIQAVMIEKNELFSSFLFLSQGREEKRNYFNPAIKKKVKIIIQGLLISSQKDLLKDRQSDPKHTPLSLED